MKKFLLVIIALFLLCTNKAIAVDFDKYSDDGKVLAALEILESIGASDVFSRLDRNSTKIIFYDLTLMSFSYAKHYAVASTDDCGNNYILINSKFRSSPSEAIAALIAHESVHQLPQATMDEEVRATTTEAQTWIKLRSRVSANACDDLVKRQNKLAALYEASTPGQNLIRESIANNSFYQRQLAMR
ncbi:MAG: hypothetical protein PHC64_08220 [Candidatus Gastranaerophilales bacterium]|nr:hypothetical protein [Candidatus Gastranaerophilales bacterium]